MKGIILAGGSGTRLYPITLGISKQLMPIYDKPMIYYPLSTLIGIGIRDILIITTPQDRDAFERLLGDGSRIGCNFEYRIQPTPDGLAQAFIIAESFINKEVVCLILGDNLFYGNGFDIAFSKAAFEIQNNKGSVIFAYHVKDPNKYGVVQFATNKQVLSIEEKPENPKSNFVIPGIYFFDSQVARIARNVQPSARGELEITEIHKIYMDQKQLKVHQIDRGNAWLDTGTIDSMAEASNFIAVIEQRQSLKIGCIEEVAFLQGFISKQKLLQIAEPLLKSGYGQYLTQLV